MEREPGWYYVRWGEGSEWDCAYWDSDLWVGRGFPQRTDPDVIGPRIEPMRERIAELEVQLETVNEILRNERDGRYGLEQQLAELRKYTAGEYHSCVHHPHLPCPACIIAAVLKEE